MDDLQNSLSQILNDPDRLQQIMSMAANLSQESSDELQLPSAEVLSRLQNIMSQFGHNDGRQQALYDALIPYLKPERRIRLQRAIQIARLSRAAGAALRTVSEAPEEGAAAHV